MNKIMSAIKAALPCPVASAEERLHRAVSVHARRTAEVYFEKALASHYKQLADEVDPYTDWNHFANLMNKWKDRSDNLVVETRRQEQAEAKVNASRVRLWKLRGETP